jgi:hypothetical protein
MWVSDLQEFAEEAKGRHTQIMNGRINALVSMTKPTGIPDPLSNYRPSTPTEAPWTVDPTGKSVSDYDRESGYDASMLEPISTGGDVIIPDDVEPDEPYTQDDWPMSDAALGEPGTFDDEHVSSHGQQQSVATLQVQQRFAAISAEMLRLTSEAYNATIKKFDSLVAASLAEARDDQKAAITAAVQAEREAIRARYTARIQPPYDKYVAAKRALDVQLFAQESKPTTADAQQQLLVTYINDVNALLDTYVAELTAILAS